MTKLFSTTNKYILPALLALTAVLIVFNTFLWVLLLWVVAFGGIFYGVKWVLAYTARSKAGIGRPSTIGNLPTGDKEIQTHVARRQSVAKIWQGVLFGSTAIGMVLLAVLMFTIIDDSFGIIAVQTEVDEASITGGRELDTLTREELLVVIDEHLSSRDRRILEAEQQFSERPNADLRSIIEEKILKTEIVGSWSLTDALFDRASIEATVAEKYPRAELEWRSWLSWDFLTTTMSSTPALAGVRTALLGSLWLIALTMIIAFPLGVGAAIYLEEYANTTKNEMLRRFNEIIQTNINNLAGVPSIIYGMLGLAIFVRALEGITSGASFGAADPTTANGRTIISGGLTMALLILPVIIINAQEAVRAVPNSLRQASMGLGATRWQTIWHHVLPNALPGILTGTILSMSRAIGETAPLIVVGAATFITTDPDGPFAKFTVLPIQIYNWTQQPSAQFRNAAAAAIIVLLVLLLSLNAAATILRSRFSRSL